MSKKVTVSVAEGPVEGLVDEDIADFDRFFQGLGNDPIVRGEKAIIKTYLAWKLGLVKGTESAGNPEGSPA